MNLIKAIDYYIYLRRETGLNAVDSCTDAAEWHGVAVAALAQALRDGGSADSFHLRLL